MSEIAAEPGQPGAMSNDEIVDYVSQRIAETTAQGHGDIVLDWSTPQGFAYSAEIVALEILGSVRRQESIDKKATPEWIEIQDHIRATLGNLPANLLCAVIQGLAVHVCLLEADLKDAEAQPEASREGL